MTVLTVAQAVVRFLEAQHTERDGVERPFFAGCWGIFGHGNVAGVGQALLERDRSDDPSRLRFLHGRNEQSMVHAAVAYARQRDRLATMAVTSSVGPGATNMVTGAALATINRLPVLLLPGDTFATRVSSPVLQELESLQQGDVSVNDIFRPVSVHFDRVNRPEQLASALLHATRILTDPAETGAVTLALPQDVQAEAHDFPDELFAKRVWHVARPVPQPAALDRAVAVIRSARRPLVVAGGGVTYSGANDALRAFAEATGIPVAESQAGKGALPYDHPQSVGAIGVTGTTAANALAAEADVVIGVGTRYSDFTTASRTVFEADGVRFVNLNVSAFDTHKHSAVSLVADAREGLAALTRALAGWTAEPAHTARATELAGEWDAVVQRAYDGEGAPPVADGLAIQSQVIGAVNELSDPRDIVVCAAGSMPGDLHKLWRTRDRKGYHVEYGFSCMGYEIPGGLGVKLAALDEERDEGADPRDVFVLVGDGSYLMMSSELVTAVAEGIKLIVVLVQNHGYASIGALSESLGSQRFGTAYRYRTDTGLDGDKLPVDLAANAASLGADVLTVAGIEELRDAVHVAQKSARTTVIHVETDPLVPAPDSPAWWDVPVAEASALRSTREARRTYDDHKTRQRDYLTPSSDSADLA
ncbi:3D-(3,5/4)-trihydroxycyclohexane-1,2-dione acylhydrolase (decyclizing) [Aeromicrobium wangtongii]|uniref:3D-(3,5/4)-trihydroxycyclohexane-1,2-dione acylhydrolase (Decyclizing) n=1 Tax=Aeromicrobium wangtongii TaxID=2969247 RepID=A0ABY5MCU2_9ACTN|nr:3D-(3,5/4)-trihydroxycyclohexane-1,2-dione acylhydrolase (decyclizing) [Aeromicrobium wangtongii]MCD9197248.1 3D-(3,5/4)-trihydroxycyclohexane-1,2-dione acylhydrolase (decyclizing) [Aeromicrobium wangtongii]UUP14744.1 3D-(3,5/4)-trihydroxycyclohexane-1,2-dione acylhydrolase (decyclizing) [Aeromicrobium wangtongii]